MAKLKQTQLVIKKGDYYTLGELKTKDLEGTAFIIASVPELGKNAVASLLITSNIPSYLKMAVYPNLIMEGSETDFGIFVGLYDDMGNPVKATEDVKLSLSANRGNFLTDILDDHVRDSRSVIKKDNHALFLQIDSDQIFATTNPFNYTIAVTSNNYGADDDLLRIVDRPGTGLLKEHENKGIQVYLPPELPTDSAAIVTYQAVLIQDKEEDEDEETTDEDEEATQVLYDDFDDGEVFPGQLDRYYTAIENRYNASVDNLRVASNDNNKLVIEEIGVVENERGFSFATIKTGQETGTVSINVDMKGWGFGSNSTKIVNPIKPTTTKIFSPTGEDKIFFNNEGNLELVIVTLDPQDRGTSTDDGIQYIITPANQIVSIPSDSTYGTIEVNVSMFGNVLKETKERKQLEREIELLVEEDTGNETDARLDKLQAELALLEGDSEEEVEEDIITAATITAYSVGTPQRPELEIAQEFILEPSPNTVEVSLPFSHIATRGIAEEYNIGAIHIIDHFGNSIPVSRDTLIDLDSSSSGIVEVPNTVLIPKGESFVSFPITTKGIEGIANIHAESSGIKFDSDFSVTTSIYNTRLSLFLSPPDDPQLEIGAQYEITAFVDDEFGEAIGDANVIFVGTNLEFFPFEVVTDNFGTATVLMQVTNDVPDLLPSAEVFADKPGYVDDSTIIEFVLKVDEVKDETILGIPPMILAVMIVGIVGATGAIAFFFLRKSKTAEEQAEADLEDEELI